MIKKAFTLSEVLMVIGIIGVIAAVTIPNLSQNVDSEKNIALLRGVVDDVNTAIGKHLAEGTSIAEKCGSKTGTEKVSCVGGILASNLKSTKNCTSGCFATSGIRNGQSCGYGLEIANKATICVGSNAGKVFIDIDGLKSGTNSYGYDTFEFLISDDGLDFISQNSRGSRRSFVSNQDETEWAMIVGNQDYLICPGVLQWGVKEGCQ